LKEKSRIQRNPCKFRKERYRRRKPNIIGKNSAQYFMGM
jgi:hypothetical protein